jgi:hypothetical protein
MPILAQTLHTFNSGSTFVGAQLDGGNLIIGETRNEENAQEGRFNLLTVIPLQEAIAIAKAVLAAQEQAEEDAAFDAWIEEQAKRREDYLALADSALESEIAF